MLKLLFLFTMMGVSATSALAQVTVGDKVVQQGIFYLKSEDCQVQDNTTDELMDYCGCTASLFYPQIKGGVSPYTESRLNTGLSMLAPAESFGCEGEPQESLPEHVHKSEYRSEYQVLINDKNYLSILQQNYSYPAGAAHGSTRSDARLFKMPEGEIIHLSDILQEDRLLELNAYIYTYLTDTVHQGKLHEGEMWDRTLKNKRGQFIANGQCSECIYFTDPTGVYLQFQLYAVGPYSLGEVQVPVPFEFIQDGALKTYLTESANAAQ